MGITWTDLWKRNAGELSLDETSVLIQIAQSGNVIAFETWKSNLPDVSIDHIVNAADNTKTSLLHYSCQYGHIDFIEQLLTCGCNLKIKNNKGQTALHFGAKFKRNFVLEKLIAADKELLNSSDKKNRTPLFYASRNGDLNAVRFLINHKAKSFIHDSVDGALPFHVAAQNGHVEVIKLFYYYLPDLLNVTTRQGWTALYLAAKRGHKDIVDYLLRVGADANIKSKSGWTVLHTSVLNQHKSIAKRLCEHDCTLVNESNVDLCTPLYLAFQNGDVDMISFLLKENADLTKLSRKNWSVLHIATENRHLDALEYFKRHLKIYTSENSDGEILDNYRLLVKCKNGDGENILEIAKRKAYAEITTFLLESEYFTEDTLEAIL